MIIPENTWVVAKNSGGIRYVTKHISDTKFEDDGKLSKKAWSNSCYYENYEEIDIGKVIYGTEQEKYF